MAKAKTTPKVDTEVKKDIMNELIPFPAEYEPKPGVPVEGVRLILNAKTMEFYSQSYDALLVSRGIPFNIDAVTFTDMLSVYISNLQPWNADPSASARAHYEKLAKDAMGDAFTVALTAQMELNNTPIPYDLNDGDSDTPAWLRTVSAMPKAKKDLANPVERRLKQLLDVLEDAGFMYQARVVSTIENAMTKALRVAEEAEADESGFQPDSVSGEVYPGDGSIDTSDGEKSENGVEAEN